MYSYSDWNGNKVVLTEEEIKWFTKICKKCTNAIGLNILIECSDHDQLKGKSKEALGIFWTECVENPLKGNPKITIDNYFIHECYEEVFNNKINISFETLEHVIAHEFAHAYQWRHCKRHTKITEEIYQKIMKYKEV